MYIGGVKLKICTVGHSLYGRIRARGVIFIGEFRR